ncbi:MAG: response regulator [Cellulomonadaceae bacterium]|uniref:Response regulator transcription factor n=1 Tax=Propioniciclava soli TaxID=2775081 RepID=A0ABZ3CFD5_9ACTN|nr:response regulator transcription factor [Propioniciclava soli]
MTPLAPSSPGPGVRLLLVDDQALLRHALRIAIDREPDLSVVGEAGTGAEAIAAARELRPDLVLMDIRMPEVDGIEATRQITNTPELAHTRVLVLSMFELDDYVYGALRAGASGFVLKDARPDQLIDAIRRVHHGESLFAPTILTSLIEHYLDHRTSGRSRGPEQLTARETEVLTLIGRGLSNDDIAAELTVSHNTVKTHISSLLSKLAARDRAQLVIAAYEHRLIIPSTHSNRA